MIPEICPSCEQVMFFALDFAREGNWKEGYQKFQLNDGSAVYLMPESRHPLPQPKRDRQTGQDYFICPNCRKKIAYKFGNGTVHQTGEIP